MSGRRGSKNAVENRGQKTEKVCKRCGEVQKPMMVIIGGKKKKMGFECSCGIVDKRGTLVINRLEG